MEAARIWVATSAMYATSGPTPNTWMSTSVSLEWGAQPAVVRNGPRQPPLASRPAPGGCDRGGRSHRRLRCIHGHLLEDGRRPARVAPWPDQRGVHRRHGHLASVVQPALGDALAT